MAGAGGRMTHEQIAKMEHNDTLTQKFDPIRIVQERFMLLQEVKRLRGLVKAAFEEGEQNGLADSHGMANEGWEVSYSRSALDTP